LADEILKLLWERWNWEKFSDSLGNRGEIWNRGKMHHCLWGDGRPCKDWSSRQSFCSL